MDERLPVNEALGIEDGDAHIFYRNAGGLDRRCAEISITECSFQWNQKDHYHKSYGLWHDDDHRRVSN